MPAHTHDRRTECYLYFGLPETERIVHLLGEPEETRHLLVADRQAIISPSWSIHSGCGTSSYSFVWAMVSREPGVRRHGRCRRTGSAVTSFSLEGRTALVTGARRGIGAAIAAGYAAAGAELILMARDAALEDTLEAIKQNGGGDASVVIADFADPAAVEAAAADLARERRIDILVNNAGDDPAGAGGRDHDRGLAARDRREPQLHLGGHTVDRGRDGGTAYREDRHDRVVAELPGRDQRPGLHREQACGGGADPGAGQRVGTGRGPGECDRARLHQHRQHHGAARGPGAEAAIRQRIPAGRWGQPEEVVGAAVFLASSAADYVNGHVLAVDGGWLAR